MKKLLCCLLFCCLGLSLFACGGKQAAYTPLEATKFARLIARDAKIPIADLTELSAAQIAKYLNIDEADFTDAAMSMDASRATATAIVVLTAQEEKGVQVLSDALSTYLADTLEAYRDYKPEEVPSLENAVLQTQGVQTVLVIGGEASVVEQTLQNAWRGTASPDP